MTSDQAQVLTDHLATTRRQLEGQQMAFAAVSNIITTNIEKLVRELTGPHADHMREAIARNLTGISQQMKHLSDIPPEVLAALSLSTSSLLSDKVGGISFAREVTGLSASTIYNLVSLNKLPATKMGNKLCFSYRALEAYKNREGRLTDRAALDTMADIMGVAVTMNFHDDGMNRGMSRKANS